MTISGFTHFDLVVLGVIVLSGLFALARGFLKELIALFSWIVATLASVKYAYLLTPMMKGMIKSEALANIAASVAIFIVVMVAMRVVGSIAASRARHSDVSALDRGLGFIFGAGRGLLIAVLIYLGLFFLFGFAEQPKWLKEARTQPALRYSSVAILSYLPDAEKNEFLKQLVEGPKEKTEAKEGTGKTPAPATAKPSMMQEMLGNSTEEAKDPQKIIQKLAPELSQSEQDTLNEMIKGLMDQPQPQAAPVQPAEPTPVTE